jgi:hypothetical protein
LQFKLRLNLASGSSDWCCVFGSSFAETIAELFNATAHVVHGFLRTGVEGM